MMRKTAANRPNTRKAALCALVTALLVPALLAGCGLSNRSDASTLIVDENGVLTCALVEPLEDGFTQAELEAYIDSEIAALYDLPSAVGDEGEATQEESTSQSASDDEATAESTSRETQSGERRITLDDCTLRDDGIRIAMTYQSYEDYVAFNDMTCFCGTVAEAKEAGFDFAPALFDEKGAPADEETINERAKEWKVLIFEEAMNVRVPDKILYTTENLKITGRLTANWTGKAAETTPAASESTSGTTSAASESTSGATSAASSTSESAQEATSEAQDKEPESTEQTVSEKEKIISRLAVNDYEIAYVIYK